MAAERPRDDGSRRGRDAEDAALAARLRRLGERLAARTPKREGERDGDADAKGLGRSGNIGRALRLSGDFIGGIVVGAFLGWLVDSLTGWSPWGLIVFMLLGFAAGTMNALRSAGLIAPRG
jgi:ATP synthase protein I